MIQMAFRVFFLAELPSSSYENRKIKYEIALNHDDTNELHFPFSDKSSSVSHVVVLIKVGIFVEDIILPCKELSSSSYDNHTITLNEDDRNGFHFFFRRVLLGITCWSYYR